MYSSVYLFVYLSLNLFFYVCIYLSIHLSIYVFTSQSIYLYIYQSLNLFFLHKYIYLSICFIYISTNPSVCLSINISINLSACLSPDIINSWLHQQKARKNPHSRALKPVKRCEKLSVFDELNERRLPFLKPVSLLFTDLFSYNGRWKQRRKELRKKVYFLSCGDHVIIEFFCLSFSPSLFLFFFCDGRWFFKIG